MERLGWDGVPGESQRVGTLRGTIIDMLGMAGDMSVCKEAYRRFCEFESSPESANIPGDLQPIIFRNALRLNEEEVYPMLKRIFEKSSFPEEQKNCLSVMGCVKDPKRHLEMLEYTLFSGRVRLQDVAFPLNSLSSTTDEGGRACWDFFRTEIVNIYSKFEAGPMWGAIVGLACRGLKTLEEAEAIENFFTNPAYSPGSAKRRLTQALEAVRTRATRLERDRNAVSEFLDGF